MLLNFRLEAGISIEVTNLQLFARTSQEAACFFNKRVNIATLDFLMFSSSRVFPMTLTRL